MEARLLPGANDQQLPVELDIPWWAWPNEHEVTVTTKKGMLRNSRQVKFSIQDFPSLKIRVDIHNDLEVVLIPDGKSAHLLERLTNLDRYSLLSSKTLAGSGYERHPIGTGPFIFKVWKPGQIQLSRNTNYWGNKALINELFFKFAGSPSALEKMLFARQLDMCITQDAAFADRARMAKFKTI